LASIENIEENRETRILWNTTEKKIRKCYVLRKSLRFLASDRSLITNYDTTTNIFIKDGTYYNRERVAFRGQMSTNGKNFKRQPTDGAFQYCILFAIYSSISYLVES
jgi:hypothetical protein